MKKILAFICRVCPFCVLARAFPDSRFAAMLRQAEKNCPACRAYAEVYGRPAHSAPKGGK